MSCLVEKFKYYIDISSEEEEILNKLEKETRDYIKNDIVYEQQSNLDDLYVVKEGWFASYSYLSDGGRLVANIHYPGDILGTMSMPFETSTCGLVALTNGTLCPFPKKGMSELLDASKRLATLIFSMGMQDNVVLFDRLKAVGRMEGESKVALFLLQIWTRLKITNGDIGHTFRLPISQEIIGDALGITSVYVSRMLQQLRQNGVIDFEKHTITIKDADKMKELCDFSDRYYKMDTDWLMEIPTSQTA